MTVETELEDRIGALSLNARLLADVLDMALAYVDKSGTPRPILRNVVLCGREGVFVVVASNGSHLIEIRTGVPVVADFTSLYDPDDVKKAIKVIRSYKKAAGEITGTIDDETLTIATEKNEDVQQIVFQKKEGTYLYYEKYISPLEGDTTRVALNGGYVAVAGRLAQKYADNKMIRVFMGKSVSGPVRMKWQADGRFDATVVIMPMFTRW